jgi:outer membrane protein
MIFAKPSSLKLLFLISGVILTSSVHAESSAADESGWQVSVALGAGVRTNPVMDNDNTPLIVIPQVNYQGERFFIQNLDFGYTFFQNDTQQLSLLLTSSYDQVFFNESGLNSFVDTAGFANATKAVPTVELVSSSIDKRRLHQRYMAGLAGFEYSQSIYGLDFQVQLLKEFTNYYDGTEARFALSKSIHMGKNDVKLTVGANWQNATTLNYFYGFGENEALGNLPYSPNSGVTSLLRFDWSYQIDQHWSLRFFTSYRHLSYQISDSPLVTDDNVITAFAGGVYHF